MQGIYRIYCATENKGYIGSSVDIYKRWKEHVYKLNKGIHHNLNLQLDWDAYGDESFEFSILKQTNDLVIAEQTYINEVWPNCYNSSQNAWNPQRNPENIIKGKQTTFDKYNTFSAGGKLDENQVISIINSLNAGELAIDIAKDYDLHYSAVYYIKQGKNWPHLKHLISLPKKPKDIVFEYFEQGYARSDIYNLMEGKHHRSTLWNWEKDYIKQRLNK